MKKLLRNVLQKRRGPTPPSNPFAALGLSTQLQNTLSIAGYAKPTSIQSRAIPTVLAGRDLLGCAQTGTGKTAAFALPILQKLFNEASTHSTPQKPKALVLAPTRELAAQIGGSFAKYAGGNGPSHLVVFGGVSKNQQIRTLRRGIDVLVATPGRLLDLLSTEAVQLDRVETFVLDEADRMLDMGFVRDVQRIASLVPSSRQTLMFSATMPEAIEKLANQLQRNPVRVNAAPVSSTQGLVSQSVYGVEKRDKTALLMHLLEADKIGRVLVFTRTKHGANRLAQKLTRSGFTTAAIHGNKSQSARERALEKFKAGTLRVVVATDIAARGIDIKDLPHVVNFDLPNEAETYVHRIGRTGRAGASGVAVSFCSLDEQPSLREIERLIGQRLKQASLPDGVSPSNGKQPSTTPRRQNNHTRRRLGRRGSYLTAEQALAV